MAKKKNKNQWKDVTFSICGEKIEKGMKPIEFEVKGLEVNKTLGLIPILKVKKK